MSDLKQTCHYMRRVGAYGQLLERCKAVPVTGLTKCGKHRSLRGSIMPKPRRVETRPALCRNCRKKFTSKMRKGLQGLWQEFCSVKCGKSAAFEYFKNRTANIRAAAAVTRAYSAKNRTGRGRKWFSFMDNGNAY